MSHFWLFSIIKRITLFLSFITLINYNSYSQQQSDLSTQKEKDSLNKVYGLDPLLYNGILYKSYYPSTVKGNQYLSNSTFVQGEATIRGVKYNNLELNLDIYKQEVLLKFDNSVNASSIIMLSKTWLEEFSIGNLRFQFHSTPETPNRIYQVLGNDSIHILYFWKKNLKVDNTYGSSNLYFLLTKDLNVLIDKTIKKYHNNRSFVHLFTKEKQTSIKKYLKKYKIRVNSASDQTMEELINYCSKPS